MMAQVTYANSMTEAQAMLWTLIKNDPTVAGITKNVLDGVPLGLTQGIGFPYVIVPTASITNENYITLTKKMDKIAFKIEIFDRKEAVSRTLCDAIRNVAETNKNLFKNNYGMFRFINSSGNLTYEMMEDNNVVYDYSLILSYEWVTW